MPGSLTKLKHLVQMTAFRRRKNVHLLAPRVHISEVNTSSVVENGVTINMETISELTPVDFFSRHPVPMEEYSINEQISAGVNLKDIPCSSLLDSPDNLDYDQNETAEEQILSALKQEATKND